MLASLPSHASSASLGGVPRNIPATVLPRLVHAPNTVQAPGAFNLGRRRLRVLSAGAEPSQAPEASKQMGIPGLIPQGSFAT